MKRLKPKEFIRDSEGVITNKNIPASWNKVYKETIIRYLNYLDPLFEKARKSSEWDFALTLLRVRGVQDAGWDYYENSLDVADAVMDMEKRLRVKGRIKVDRYLTRNLCALLAVALCRLQHGIKTNLTSVAYFT